MRNLNLIAAVLLSLAGSASSQEFDPADLAEGIAVFECRDAELQTDFSLVFIENEDGITLSGTSDLVINEVGRGLRLTNPSDPNSLAMFAEVDGDGYVLRQLSEKGFTESSCREKQPLLEQIVRAIAPKLDRNLSALENTISETIPSLEAVITEQELVVTDLGQENNDLRIENRRLISLFEENVSATENVLETQNSNLANNNRRLSAQIDELRSNLDLLITTRTQKTALELGAFKPEYGYDTSDKLGTDFNFNAEALDSGMCLRLFQGEHLLNQNCMTQLRDALLPNDQ